MPRRDAYIYFRVARADEAAAVAAVRDMQVRRAAGLRCELLRRADEHGDTVTLMEIYRDIAAPEQERIEREASLRLAPWLIGPRHTEVFEPCA
jgi:hypothetical protein